MTNQDFHSICVRHQLDKNASSGVDVDSKAQIKALKAIRGIERKEHFENGGSLVSWRGGTRTVTTDRKKQRDKRKCRKRVQTQE